MIVGVVYKIFNDNNNKTYIGSTFKSINERLKQHVNEYNRYLNGKFNFVSSFDIIKDGGYKIDMISMHNNINKYDLRKFEKEAIIEHRKNDFNIVNKHIPNTLNYENGIEEYNKEYYINNKDKLNEYQKEYYDTNKEKIKEYKKEYYDTNKEKINEYNKEKFICSICNGRYTKSNKAQHLKTKKHIKIIINIKNLTINNK